VKFSIWWRKGGKLGRVFQGFAEVSGYLSFQSHPGRLTYFVFHSPSKELRGRAAMLCIFVEDLKVGGFGLGEKRINDKGKVMVKP